MAHHTATQTVLRRWLAEGAKDIHPFWYWRARERYAAIYLSRHRTGTKIRAAWIAVRHACLANTIGWASR